MTPLRLRLALCFLLSSAVCGAGGQTSLYGAQDLRLHIAMPQSPKHALPPAVVWLESAPGTPTPPFVPHGHYTLLQKNRMFFPHLQVVPVGAVVSFPNADPFFHNVFSLFEGKRFDLGLYEAGSSKAVTFSRQGVSYVFCNIHPEMSAVVLALATSLYATADDKDSVTLSNVPIGDYILHIWIEGMPQLVLDNLTRPLHMPPHNLNLGTIALPATAASSSEHKNKFGEEYDPALSPSYGH